MLSGLLCNNTALLILPKVTVYWTNLKNCLLCPMTLQDFLTALAANVSWLLAQGPSPALTCKPVPSCGARDRQGDNLCAKLVTSLGLMAPPVVAIRYATEEHAQIIATQLKPR